MTCRNYENYWSVFKPLIAGHAWCLHGCLSSRSPWSQTWEKDSNAYIWMCVGQKIPGKMGGEWDTAVYLSPNWVQCYVYSVTCALTCRENQGPWIAWLQVLLLTLCPQIRSLNQELSSSQDQMQFPFIPYQWASVTANPHNYSNKSHAPTGASRCPTPLIL